MLGLRSQLAIGQLPINVRVAQRIADQAARLMAFFRMLQKILEILNRHLEFVNEEIDRRVNARMKKRLRETWNSLGK